MSLAIEAMRNMESVPSRSAAVDISSTDFDVIAALGFPCTAIYVGTGGTVIAELVGDSTSRTYKNVPDGTELLGRFSSVIRTGTTATDMIARVY
ncbi:MAG: hypothetical protein SFV23_12715 [Planctomycetaceae bacterium]|nr:hypothetical protein [Planctomycetaceae bacterium]